jgi:hypothetical protein
MSKENLKKKEKLVTVPDGGIATGETGRLTVGRNITSTLSFNYMKEEKRQMRHRKERLSDVRCVLCGGNMRITRGVRSTRSYNRKHTHLSSCNSAHLKHTSNTPYTLNQEQHIFK